MTTHTAEGLRPSPRPRPDAGDPGRDPGGDPGRDHTPDPWTDWSWPDSGWTRSPAPPSGWTGTTATTGSTASGASGASWASGASGASGASTEDTAAHRFTWPDDPEDDPRGWAGHRLDRHDSGGHDTGGHDFSGHDIGGHHTSGLDHLDPGRAGWLPLLDDVADGPSTDLDRHVPRTPDRGDPDAEWSGGPSRRRRRVVGTLGALAALSVGFLGGVVADRLVTAPGDGAVRLAGEVETDADGTLAVRGVDGALTAVRTSTGTRVVTANPVAGDLPTGTMVDVWTRRAPDGALEATAVAVRP